MGDLTDEQIDAAWSFSTGGSIVTEDMRAFARKVAEEAVRQEREAILAALEDLEEPAWYGYENPNNFDDGKRACAAAIRALR